MVFVEGKQVVFSETFYAQHSDHVLVHAQIGPMPTNLRITFAQPADNAGMAWSVDPDGLVQMSITPSTGLGSSGSKPTRLGQHADGTVVYITYTQQTMGTGSLIHLFLLKDQAPAAT